MKSPTFNTVLGSLLLIAVFSCNKSESTGAYNKEDVDYAATAEISDSISSVATLEVKDKQFIKSAEVNMEVADVYDATVFIEKSLVNLKGFVTSSELNSQIISEQTFTISDEKAMMVRRFETENNMQVRIPTEKLGEFLQIINDKKVFLNSRVISAEDVTANIKLAELEAKRNAKTGTNISQLKTDKDKVNMTDDNESENNYQKIAGLEMTDQLKYSTVQIFLKEPQVRIAKIPLTNTQNIDDQYKSNFFYEAKNAVVNGFYLIQQIFLGLITIWPLLIIGGLAIYFFRRRKTAIKFQKQDSKQ